MGSVPGDGTEFPGRSELPCGELGVVFGQRSQLWWDLPVIDSFELLRDIYQLSPEDYHIVLTELADILPA